VSPTVERCPVCASKDRGHSVLNCRDRFHTGWITCPKCKGDNRDTRELMLGVPCDDEWHAARRAPVERSEDPTDTQRLDWLDQIASATLADEFKERWRAQFLVPHRNATNLREAIDGVISQRQSSGQPSPVKDT
jgi:hypothetical protein